MRAKLLRLTPNSRFHFGKASIDHNTALANTDSFLRSDILFSALVNNLASIRPKDEVDRFVEAFREQKILISSGFYCLENTESKEKIGLLPRPVNAQNRIRIADYDQIKKTKKVRFICSDTLNNMDVVNWNKSGEIAISENNLAKLRIDQLKDLVLYKNEIVTNVGIHKANENAKGPFAINCVQIADLSENNVAVHFYFLYEIRDESCSEWFEQAVSLLQFNGVGGERSSGCGMIQSVEDLALNDLNIEVDANSPLRMTLGLASPKDQTELSLFQAYKTDTRGGRESEYGTLQTVRMIIEGSLFEGDIQGNIVVITPSNSSMRFLRLGMCCSIPVPSFYSISES